MLQRTSQDRIKTFIQLIRESQIDICIFVISRNSSMYNQTHVDFFATWLPRLQFCFTSDSSAICCVKLCVNAFKSLLHNVIIYYTSTGSNVVLANIITSLHVSQDHHHTHVHSNVQDGLVPFCSKHTCNRTDDQSTFRITQTLLKCVGSVTILERLLLKKVKISTQKANDSDYKMQIHMPAKHARCNIAMQYCHGNNNNGYMIM